MRTFRFETFNASTLRFYDPNGRLIDSRQLSGIDAFVDEVENGYAAVAPTLPRLGQRLYEWLDGPTERWLEKVLPGPGGVALNVDVADGLRHLPWELLVRDGAFLCANATRPFTPVRRVSQEARAVEPANRPLRVLFMACAPEDGGTSLDFEGEERVILDATRGRPMELVVEESGSLEGLRERMEWYGPGYFDVFHLTGHATVIDGKPRFVMEDELGFRHYASAEEVAEAFSGNWPRLVFLSGCRTGQAPDRGAVPSMAEALVAAGAPAVLGWALPVGDVSASRAAAALYEHLTVGKRIDEAVARARRELLEDNSRYWHLLRLYADATPLLPIVTPPGTKNREALPIREAASEFLDAGKVEVCPRDRFVGRRRVIQRCLRVLRGLQGQQGYAEGVLLHGMGGLGKSSLAARLCDRLHDYRRVVVVGKLDGDGFLRAFSSKLDDPEAIAALQQADLPLRQRLRRVLQAHLASTPHLFVFDDFEQSLDETSAGHVAQAGARDVLVPLLAAIREANSASRVIVTSRYTFPLPGPARLAEEGLETMRGSELKKKTAQLEGFAETEETNPALAARARMVGAGNPRLLERLNALLADPGTDASSILSALETTAEEFREELLLDRLLEQQEPAFRQLVALASVYGIPVSREGVEAAAGTDLTDAHLERTVARSLVDRGHNPGDGAPLYYVSQLIGPLLREDLAAAERRDAQARASEFLYQAWSDDRLPNTEANLLEIHRLALAAGLPEIAVKIANRLATEWINRSRFRDAELLSSATLQIGEDYRVLHNLARAERFLGKTAQAREHYRRALEACPASDATDILRERATIIHNIAELILQQGEVERALELFQESLSLSEQSGDVLNSATTVQQVAIIYAQQGEVKRALELFQDSITLAEQIEDVQEKASILHNMAATYAHQGEVKRALELYEESLSLNEQSGDVRGKAATLHQIAMIHAQQGEVTRALELYQESIKLAEQIGSRWSKAVTLTQVAGLLYEQGNTEGALLAMRTAAEDLATVQAWADLPDAIANLSKFDGSRATSYLAQALWLAARVEVPAENLTMCAVGLLYTVGVTLHSAPTIAAGTLIHVIWRTERHPDPEPLRQQVFALLIATAEARGIEEQAAFDEWLKAERLLDPKEVLPRTLRELEALVPKGEWLFDPSQVGAA